MSTQTHPLILVAATSVTIASLAAAAHFAGWLGNPASAEKAAAPTEVAAVQKAPSAEPIPAPVAAPNPPAEEAKAAKPVAQAKAAPHKTEKTHKMTSAQSGGADVVNGAGRPAEQKTVGNDTGIDVIPADKARAESKAPAVCHECGTVEQVYETKTDGEGTGLGAVAGGVLGGLLGNQLGKGHGRDVGAVVGAVGGAFAGHQAEKKIRAEKRVEVSVRMDDGSVRTIGQEVPGRWHQGDRVRIEQGRLQAN